MKKRGSLVQQEDWGQGKNCTLFLFDNVANGRADARTLNPKQSGDLQLILEFGAAPNINMPSLRTCWRSTRTEQCCTTSTSLEEKRHGTSGSEQCAIGLFGKRRSGLDPVFLRDGGVRPFAQDTPQDLPARLHRQHRPPRPTRRTLVGTLDPRQHVRSPGQLRPPLGKVRASRPFERVDRLPLEVPDDQRQIPSSHQQQQLW